MALRPEAFGDFGDNTSSASCCLGNHIAKSKANA